jgi:hypothetical protein
LASIGSRAFSKDADWVETVTSIFDLDLTSHDCLNDFVTFLLRASSVYKDALKALAKHPNK